MRVVCSKCLECKFKNCYHKEEHEPDEYCHSFCEHLEKHIYCMDVKNLERKLKIEKLNNING